MKLILPNNIFAKIFISELKELNIFKIEYSPSALISKKIATEADSLGLIPTLDILTFKDFKVSSEIGISFNALLSNSYFQFKEDQKTLSEIFLWGDVTVNEVILSKILFKEFYNINIKTTLLREAPSDFNKNMIVVGDENFSGEFFKDGLSLAEEVIELITAPYVNFVLAGQSDSVLKEFASNNKKYFTGGHIQNFYTSIPGLSKISQDYITANIQHLIFDFENQDLEGIKRLLQMSFYYGIINDMVEVKFV